MKVVDMANSLIGQREETGNVFKIGTPLGDLLHEAGQRDGEAWCCYLAEALFCKAYVEHSRALRKLFSANCVKTLENFRKAGYSISANPIVGSLMIMQTYRSGIALTTGHAGIVTVVETPKIWTSVEGNTNEEGAREGTTVLPKKRTLNYPLTGKRVAGFVLIRETLKITS